MRNLTIVGPSSGHIVPVAAIARALRHAGHTILAYAPGPDACREAERENLPARDILTVRIPRHDRPVSASFTPPTSREESNEQEWLFARSIETSRSIGLIDDERPDLVLIDEDQISALVACEITTTPAVVVTAYLDRTFIRTRQPILDFLSDEFDLPYQDIDMLLGRHLVLDSRPPSFRLPDEGRTPNRITVRPALALPGPDAPPDWLASLDGRPLVVATAGTGNLPDTPRLLDLLVSGTGLIPDATVAIATGPRYRLAREGADPFLYAAQSLPLAHLLPHTALVIHHGGSGTVLNGLAHGVAQVVLPMGSDQERNASRAKALGFGYRLSPRTATPNDIRRVAARVMAEPSYRGAAMRIRDEIAIMPDPTQAVAVIAQKVGKGDEQ